MRSNESATCATIEQSSTVALPRVVTLKDSGGWRFLIDRQDPNNPDMFSGFKIDANGSIGQGPSRTTGEGGRLNLHRSHFEEPTVKDFVTVERASDAVTFLYTHGLLTGPMRDHARRKIANL